MGARLASSENLAVGSFLLLFRFQVAGGVCLFCNQARAKKKHHAARRAIEWAGTQLRAGRLTALRPLIPCKTSMPSFSFRHVVSGKATRIGSQARARGAEASLRGQGDALVTLKILALYESNPSVACDQDPDAVIWVGWRQHAEAECTIEIIGLFQAVEADTSAAEQGERGHWLRIGCCGRWLLVAIIRCRFGVHCRQGGTTSGWKHRCSRALGLGVVGCAIGLKDTRANPGACNIHGLAGARAWT
eukprot:scaffold12703_cov101-Isochrysis_galbana.AAC.2